MNRLKDYFINRIKNFNILFKSPKAHPSYLIYILLIFIAPIFLITFQNCKATNLDTSSIGSGENTLSNSSYNKGHIIRIDPETDDFMEDGLLPIDTNIKMKFINAHEDADNYKWTINRGFDAILTEAATDGETYQTQFSQVGAYDVFANSYESETFLRSGSKRFVAGESCSLTDVLEIELSSGSLKTDQSATFGLRHSDDFSSTKWKATLPSGEIIEQTAEEDEDSEEDPNTLDISFEDESEGSLLIEVSASHVDRTECLTYRKQSLNVTSTLKPHFNPIVITDGSNEIAVMLENNDVYKYERPTNGGPYLEVEVLHADTCNYQVNEGDETSFTCDSGSINISLDSGTECSETVVNLSASTSNGEEVTQIYYNYCPKDSDYCYFGPSDERQGYHLCSRNIASEKDDSDDSEGSVGRSSFEADPANGRCGDNNDECRIGALQDLLDTETHYQWQCLGINGGTTTDCEKLIPIDGVCDNSQRNSCSSGNSNDAAIADTNTYYKWSCEGLHDGSTANDCQIRKPIDGVCDNNQRNGCSTGTANDAAIADTTNYYKWHCEGEHGGTTATNCQRALPPQPVNGACNNSQRNGCSAGTANDAAIADTTNYYKWQCEGQHGGTTTTSCQIEKPVNGACDNTQRNSCSTGTANDSAIADTTNYYKWQCEGLHGGTTVTSCQIRKPINGACDNTQRNSCSTGTANDSAIADTTNYYKWQCEGLHGGTTVTSCQIRKPINGACNNSQRNSCSTGNPSPILDSTTHHRWHCVGLHGGTTATTCQKAIPPDPVNGTCDNSVRNGCSLGTANDSAITDTTNYYKWQCEGLHGGTTTTNCQIRKPINGACNNSQRNTCSTGTANDAAIADTTNYYKWHCVGQHGGTTARNCQMARPINGVCNNSQRNGCTSGDSNDSAIADTSTLYKWHCVGRNGGTTATGCQKAIPINGVCDNSQRNSCTSGDSNDAAIADTPTLYKWHCVGRHGGSTATNCQKVIPINGVCDNSQRNSCSFGTPNDAAIDDTSTHYTWYCLGSNGGTNATDCQKAKPVNGICDNTERNGCLTGTPNDAAADDTTTHYAWNCDGLHGGTTATGCEKIRPIHGYCNNNTVNDCGLGTLEDIDDTDTQYKWRCKGLNGGRTATCSKSIYTNGDCNRHRDWCDKGTFRDIDDTDVHYLWECVSPDGGTTASCQQLKQTAHCGGSVTWNEEADQSLIEISTCLTGTPTETEDTTDKHKWRCDWYESVAFCVAAKHGQCLTSFPWCNSNSKRISINDGAGTWSCAGGTSTADCSR